MNTPRSCLRITAYHMVVASRVPWIGCQAAAACPTPSATPAATSWRRVAT